MNDHPISSDSLDEDSVFDDRFIDLVAEDVKGSNSEALHVNQKKTELANGFYSRIFKSLIGLEFKENEAEDLWGKLLEHKYNMSTQLKRNVGIRVAAIDYFTNITGTLSSVKVMDKNVFLETTDMAISDGLTGLYNHRYFYDRLRKQIQDATDNDSILSIILIDVDYFKDYNDINGHVAGDVALRKIAKIIRTTVEDLGYSCRYGGEEFTVILPQTSKAKAMDIAEKIRQSIEEEIFPNEFALPSGRLTISLGIAEFPLDGTDSRGLMEYADRALYHSKANGKNQISVMAQNRRREQRRIIACPAEIIIMEDGNNSIERNASIANISIGGVRCRTNFKLKLNQAVRIRIDKNIIDCDPLLAVVVRCARVEQSVWSLGFRFIRLREEVKTKLIKFISEDE